MNKPSQIGQGFRVRDKNRVQEYAVFMCECGQRFITRVNNIRSGNTKSCGCSRNRDGIGRLTATRHPLYELWKGMKARCYNKNAISYRNYGSRGITVCERWRTSFENFLADMGERPDGMTLDRKNVDGDYSPENCRWASYETQNRTSRNCRLTEASVAEIKHSLLNGDSVKSIAAMFEVSQGTIRMIRNGKSWRNVMP